MEKRINKFVFWAPRILTIIFILFLAIFSLDIFDMNLNLWGTILGLFTHNIPSLVLLVILIISWKHDLLGGIIFMALGVACVIGTIVALSISSGMINPVLIIGGIVFLLIGILFLVGWSKKRK